ncbi:MAG: type III-A CRISPR-associated RAMP protein Csm5, partial [Bacteroidetes bacterium]
MHITLQTLSPVHIGTGEDLSYLDYYIHQRDYYRISQSSLLAFLQAQGTEHLQAYAAWIDEISTDLYEMETRRTLHGRNLPGKDFNQKRKALRQELQLSRFMKAQKLEKAFQAYLTEPRPGLRHYRLNGNKKQQIRALISTGTEAVYLPGSSLKGTVRTAMIYQVLTDDTSGMHKKALLADIKRCLKRYHDDTRSRDSVKERILKENVGKALEYSTAYCGILQDQFDHKEKRTISRRNDRDEMMDLFKFLEISDARLREGSKTPVEVVASNLYLPSKVKQGGSVKRMATLQRQPPGMEVIRKGVTFDLEVQIAVARMFRIYQRVQQQNQRREWLDMETKVKALYGLDLTQLTETE